MNKRQYSKYLVVGETERMRSSKPIGSMASRTPLPKEVGYKVRDKLSLQLAEVLLQVVQFELLAHNCKLCL